MAKINSPTPTKPNTDAQTVAAPAVDMAPLLTALAPHIFALKEAEGARDEAILETVIEIRSFREANENVERDQIRTVIQTAIAESYGLKLEQVAKKPDETLKRMKPADYAVRNSCYTLTSQLLGVAWAKDEKADAKVAKALEKNERRFTVLVKLGQKPQNNPQRDPDANKITRENFSAKLTLFVEKAKSDLGEKTTIEEVWELIEKYLEAATAAPKE